MTISDLYGVFEGLPVGLPRADDDLAGLDAPSSVVIVVVLDRVVVVGRSEAVLLGRNSIEEKSA